VGISFVALVRRLLDRTSGQLAATCLELQRDLHHGPPGVMLGRRATLGKKGAPRSTHEASLDYCKRVQMRAVLTIAMLVIAADQAIKWLLRRTLGGRTASLGRLGTIRLVHGRIWLSRVWGPRPFLISAVWMSSAGALILLSALVPPVGPWVAMLVGGSLSHALESAYARGIDDYVCLEFWPAFNFADVAITAGAIGVVYGVPTALGGCR
jgi:lipoprotein signal peptidase